MKPAVIDRFSGPYWFLSNFYVSIVSLDGVHYSTVEHAYQAAKTLDAQWRTVIQRAPTPSEAKRLGRQLTLRPRWNMMKTAVMRRLLEQKFAPGSELFYTLLATRPATLIEGNTWGDTFWGVCNGTGENMLGQLLMSIRDLDLQQAKAKVAPSDDATHWQVADAPETKGTVLAVCGRRVAVTHITDVPTCRRCMQVFRKHLLKSDV